MNEPQALKQRALKQRARLLGRLRQFFDQRGFLEVETPLLSTEVIPELHLEPMELVDPALPASGEAQTEYFLQASPEAHMKRLLSAGATAIYQVTRSFRAGERGRLHRPEFTLVEWYRVGDDMWAGMELLGALVQHLLATPPAVHTSYREAFLRQTGACPHEATCDELAHRAAALGVVTPEGMDRSHREEWLDLLLDTRVQPTLGRQEPEILYHYPASQAALANLAADDQGVPVAERFELFFHGVELANGYHELTDAAELRARLERVNAARSADHRRALPMPEKLLAAMELGLPPCAGVALGFDRLLMLAMEAKSIDQK
jgi:lysyl-tRNA synthetase class 2